MNDADRARLRIDAATLDASPAVVTQIIAILQQPVLASQLTSSLRLLQWDAHFFAAVTAHGEPTATRFAATYDKLMSAAADDPAIIEAEQLNAVRARLAASKAFAKDHKVSAELASQSRARIQLALAKRYEPYTRTGVVNSAANILDLLDDNDEMYSLYVAELAHSTTPYYYMRDLGELEEARGRPAEALQWYARSYESAQGVATRYSWGSAYLQALTRLAPTEHDRVREVGVAVLGELDGPDRVHGRVRENLKALDAALRKWNGQHHYDSDILALQRRMRGICGKIPKTDPSRESCHSFLS